MSLSWWNFTAFLPTYGNYGGIDYSGGVHLTPGQQPDYSVPAADPLDSLFKAHDLASEASSSLQRAQGDLALLEGIDNLPDGTLTSQGHLWAGVATLAMIADIAVRQGHPELLSLADSVQYGSEAFEHIAASGIHPLGFVAADGFFQI